MQLVGANRAFQHLFYSFLLFINACYLTLLRVKENQALKTSVLAAFWKYVKWLGNSSVFANITCLLHRATLDILLKISCPLLSTCIKPWGPKGMHLILTQRLGTRLDRLTCRGANIWSCWRQDIAAAWTSESEWSCVIAHPTKQEERIVEIVAPLPNDVRGHP